MYLGRCLLYCQVLVYLTNNNATLPLFYYSYLSVSTKAFQDKVFFSYFLLKSCTTLALLALIPQNQFEYPLNSGKTKSHLTIILKASLLLVLVLWILR